MKGVGSGHVRLKVAVKSYKFDVVPLGGNGDLQVVVKGPQEGFARQLAVINYVPQTIPKLAAGALAGTLAMAVDNSWTGWISDSQGGVKGANEKAGECTTKCVKEPPANYLFVTDANTKDYL